MTKTAHEVLAQIQRDLHAPKSERNDFGKYNYRTASAIIQAFKDVAPEGADLTMSDRIEVHADRLFLVATATFHWQGEAVSVDGVAMHALQKKGMDDAQISGACSTYARKYALCGLLNVDDSEGDPDTRDNRDTPEPARAPAPEAERDPIKVRDGLLAAIAKRDSHDGLRQLLSTSKYHEAMEWLQKVDPPKAYEVAYAANERENALAPDDPAYK